MSAGSFRPTTTDHDRQVLASYDLGGARRQNSLPSGSTMTAILPSGEVLTCAGLRPLLGLWAWPVLGSSAPALGAVTGDCGGVGLQHAAVLLEAFDGQCPGTGRRGEWAWQ
jgi:hypothetical protein